MFSLRVAVAAAGTVAALGLWLSFVALSDLAARAGWGPVEAGAWAVVLDGLIVVATLAVYSLHGRRGYAWAVFTFASLASLAANVTHALLSPGELPAALSAAIAAAPPLAHLVATHLTARLLHEHRDRAGESRPAPALEPIATPEITPAPARDPEPAPVPLHAVADEPAAEAVSADPEPAEVPVVDDDRARALAALEDGATQREAAELVGVSVRTIRRWQQLAAVAVA